MLNIYVYMPGFVCVPVGSETLHDNQIIVRLGILLLKRQETVRPGASLYGIKTGKAFEQEFGKSIVVIEYPPRSEHSPLWVRGGIPVESSDVNVNEIRNRMTFCRCGKSCKKPFCDGSHVGR
jgi:hypothetical protein